MRRSVPERFFRFPRVLPSRRTQLERIPRKVRSRNRLQRGWLAHSTPTKIHRLPCQPSRQVTAAGRPTRKRPCRRTNALGLSTTVRATSKQNRTSRGAMQNRAFASGPHSACSSASGAASVALKPTALATSFADAAPTGSRCASSVDRSATSHFCRAAVTSLRVEVARWLFLRHWSATAASRAAQCVTWDASRPAFAFIRLAYGAIRAACVRDSPAVRVRRSSCSWTVISAQSSWQVLRHQVRRWCADLGFFTPLARLGCELGRQESLKREERRIHPRLMSSAMPEEFVARLLPCCALRWF